MNGEKNIVTWSCSLAACEECLLCVLRVPAFSLPLRVPPCRSHSPSPGVPSLDDGSQTDHGRRMKTNDFEIRADATLTLVVAEAMEKTGLGQSDILRLCSLRGVPEITSALVGG